MKEVEPENRYLAGPLKRVFDVVASLAALLVLSPLLLVLALLIAATSGPPVLFRQERAGRLGRPFLILKFRTMRPGSGRGLLITGRGDGRVTRLGRFLRAAKLDELPQLLNVLRGEMSMVGPRPEVPEYAARYSSRERRVLEARPGLTDPASILFRDEEGLLGRIEPESRERYYLEELLPRKLALNLAYVERAGIGYDLRLLLETAWRVLVPGRP